MPEIKTEIVVVGGGIGGYGAAFYLADQGKKVILVEQDKRLGGVCLNRGCIPSKALLHVTKLIAEAKESGFRGISFSEPKIDLSKMRAWKESIIAKLSNGVSGLAQKRGVEVLYGRGHFEDSTTLRVETSDGQKFVKYEKAIIAVGSKPAMPGAFDLGNKRIMTSTEALEIEDIPQDLLVVGGGYIGMELGTVYATLGSKVVVVEALPTILAGADPDLVRPVMAYAQKNFKEVRLKTKVTKMTTSGKQIKVVVQTEGQPPKEELYDKVLVCVGRSPNCNDLGLKNTRVQMDDKGFIKVDSRQQTADPHLYAIGDVVGGAMLAHKAAKEARVAAEALTGGSAVFENIVMPAVVFTDPEVAWCGLTESEARQKGIAIETIKYPWSASGRALSFDRTDGMTKLVLEPESHRILGVGLVGAGAGELISEGVLAIEMGATVGDLAECIHPHPTLSETLMESAEAFLGHSAHYYVAHKKNPEASLA